MKLVFTASIFSFACLSAGIIRGQAGGLDNSFGNGGVVTTDLSGVQNYGHASVLQPDGRILVVGVSYGPVDTTFTVLRYESDGALDPTFGTGGAVQLNFNGSEAQGLDIALQADGRIVVGGIATGVNYDFGIARLMPDGSLDPSFDGDGYLITNAGPWSDSMCSLLVQTDGRILIAGISFSPNAGPWAIMRFEADGSPDPTFGIGGIVTEPADTATVTLPTAMALQSDGKILLAGRQGSAGTEDFGITRRNTDGSPDLSFGTNGWAIWDINSTNDQPGSIVVQPDGKIIVCGASGISAPPWNWSMTLLRCNADGTLDNSFGQGGITSVYGGSELLPIARCALQFDGRIVVSSFIRTMGGNDMLKLYRCTSNGLLDPSFDLDGSLISDPTSSSEWAYDVLIQPDQKIVVAGLSGADIMVLRYLNDLDIGVAEFAMDAGTALVYPNPINAASSFTYTLTKEESLTLQVFDATGRVARSLFSNAKRPPGEHRETLDLSGLAAANYTVVLSSAEGSVSVKVVKE